MFDFPRCHFIAIVSVKKWVTSELWHQRGKKCITFHQLHLTISLTLLLPIGELNSVLVSNWYQKTVKQYHYRM